MFDPRLHNYYSKLIELYEQGKVPPGRIMEIDIFHDDWCSIYRGGYYDCEPEVRLRPRPEEN
jgi:hypothetical protein